MSSQRLLEDQVEIRSMCISQVLGTDMKKHFDITSRFQVKLLPPSLLPVSDCAYITFLVFRTHQGSQQTMTGRILRMLNLNDTSLDYASHTVSALSANG